jgi:lipopolysaccharide transport system ATP-binding protein
VLLILIGLKEILWIGFSMSNIALKIENLTKEYRLGTIGHGTLQEDLQSYWAKLRGKEDPNSLINSNHNFETEKKHFLALDNINLEIKKGDRVGIIGKNGAGKSTLLKVLSRITAPTRGNIYINGRVGSLLEVGTGFHPELTGRENIYLNGTIMGMRRAEISLKLDEIVDFSGVEKFIDTPVKRYSSGMRVRLGFAVAAHLEPEILIVDEVLAVGDAEFQKKAIGKMESVSDEDGRTILFVSHNMASVSKLCNLGVLLSEGSCSFIGNMEETINLYLDFNNSTEFSNIFFFNKSNKNFFYMSSLKIFSDSNSKNNIFSVDEKLNFELNLEVEIAYPDLYALFIIKKEGETMLFSMSKDISKELLFDLDKGKYKLNISIPPRILGHGRYTVDVRFTSRSLEKRIVDKSEDEIKFILNDFNTEKGNNRPGFLSTIPEWTLKKIMMRIND